MVAVYYETIPKLLPSMKRIYLVLEARWIDTMSCLFHFLGAIEGVEVFKRIIMGVQGTCGVKMKQLPFMGIVSTVMLFIIYRTTKYQFVQTEVWWYYLCPVI